jgi:hypothetical protein
VVRRRPEDLADGASVATFAVNVTIAAI